MITTETVRDLARLIDALSDAADQLEDAYLRKDFATVEKIKKFMLDTKLKIDMIIT